MAKLHKIECTMLYLTAAMIFIKRKAISCRRLMILWYLGTWYMGMISLLLAVHEKFGFSMWPDPDRWKKADLQSPISKLRKDELNLQNENYRFDTEQLVFIDQVLWSKISSRKSKWSGFPVPPPFQVFEHWIRRFQASYLRKDSMICEPSKQFPKQGEKDKKRPQPNLQTHLPKTALAWLFLSPSIMESDLDMPMHKYLGTTRFLAYIYVQLQQRLMQPQSRSSNQSPSTCTKL